MSDFGGLKLSVKDDDIVMVMGDLYVKTPEALKRLLAELQGFGYEIDNLREAEHRTVRATVEVMEQNGWSLWYAKLPDLRRGKCKSCGSLIDIFGIETHGHTCEVCGEVTYYLVVDGTQVRFEFLSELYTNVLLAPQLNMKAKRWDTNEGYLYLYYEFLDHGGFGVISSKRAEAYLAEHKGMWEIVEGEGEPLLKVRYPFPRNSAKSAIELHEIWGHYWNHTIVKVWDGIEYGEYDRLPIPETISIYEAWHWMPIAKSPTIHARIMSAVRQISDKGWYYQDGRAFFQDGIQVEFEKFIRHFTELDAVAFATAWPRFRKDGPGFIDDFARFCHEAPVVEDRPNMWNSVNAVFNAMSGKELTDREIEAAERGTDDPALKNLLDLDSD